MGPAGHGVPDLRRVRTPDVAHRNARSAPGTLGTGTLFTKKLRAGDAIKIASEVFTVVSIASDTQLTPSKLGAGASNATVFADPTIRLVKNGASQAKLRVERKGNVCIGPSQPEQRLRIEQDKYGEMLAYSPTSDPASSGHLESAFGTVVLADGNRDTGMSVNGSALGAGAPAHGDHAVERP